MKRFVFLLLCSLLLTSACVSSLRKLSLRSCQVTGISPDGFSRLRIHLRIGLDNPVGAFDLRDIRGCLKWGGKPYADLSADDMSVASGMGQEYETVLHLSFTGGLPNLLSLVMIFENLQELEGVALDVSACVKMRGGERRTVRLEDVHVKELIEGMQENNSAIIWKK